MGFGGGAMIGSPLAQLLMSKYATASSIGVAETFVTMALIYAVFMTAGAIGYRVPAAGWKPAGWTPPAANTANAMISAKHVHLRNAHRTPQFWLIWAVLCLNVTAGIGVIGAVSPMLQETSGSAMIGWIRRPSASVTGNHGLAQPRSMPSYGAAASVVLEGPACFDRRHGAPRIPEDRNAAEHPAHDPDHRRLPARGWSVWLNDFAGVAIIFLSLTGFSYWLIKRNGKAMGMSLPARKGAVKWLFRSHGPLVGLIATLPILYIAATAIPLNHIWGFIDATKDWNVR
eukprot:gene13191-17538_t